MIFSFVSNSDFRPSFKPYRAWFLLKGGSGFEAIWCVASVIPYPSIIGAPNTRSNSFITCDGSEAEEDRRNLNLFRSIISLFRWALAKIAWCIVGTAVNHEGEASSNHRKNFNASKPGVHHTDPPAAMDADTAIKDVTCRNNRMGITMGAGAFRPQRKSFSY